ncbi:Uncharacterised protein [Vibrio cholerae]|nr:Uncharacterised protein [Vibrio cholerae]
MRDDRAHIIGFRIALNQASGVLRDTFSAIDDFGGRFTYTIDNLINTVRNHAADFISDFEVLATRKQRNSSKQKYRRRSNNFMAEFHRDSFP